MRSQTQVIESQNSAISESLRKKRTGSQGGGINPPCYVAELTAKVLVSCKNAAQYGR